MKVLQVPSHVLLSIFPQQGNKNTEKVMNFSVIGFTLRIAVKKKASSKEMQRYNTHMTKNQTSS